MPTIVKGTGDMIRTAGNGLYTWTWKDDPNQVDVDTSAAGATPSAAYNAIGAAALAMASSLNGVLARVQVIVTIVMPDP
jgi:hypothetical protein